MTLILVLYLFLYKITVYEDSLEIKSIFGNKKYYFNEVIIESMNSIKVMNKECVEIDRITGFIDPLNVIYTNYKRYNKERNIKLVNENNKVKYNHYIKNFSIFGLIYSVICLILGGISIYYQLKEPASDGVVIIACFMTMGVLSLIISSVGLMSYLNFSIVIAKDLITFKNLFGMKKQYKIEDISYTFNGTVIKLIINGKRKKFH